MSIRQFRLLTNYPFSVIDTTEKLENWRGGYKNEIYTNEGFAKYISLSYSEEYCTNHGQFKRASEIRLKMKYILWEFPEYKL